MPRCSLAAKRMHKNKKKPYKNKKSAYAAGGRLRQALSVYFAAQIVLSAVFLLACGLWRARSGSEYVWNGAETDCITMYDLNNWAQKTLRRLYSLYNNFENEWLP